MKLLCYDTALNEEYTLVKLMQCYPRYISLFTGTDDEAIWDAAPYLFEVKDNFYKLRDDAFINLDHCIVFDVVEPKEEVARFLQSYMYKNAGGKAVYYRVWDPRVLLKSFSEWPEKDKIKFFEFFESFYTESETDKNYFNKWQPGRFHQLIATKVSISEVLPDFVEEDEENDENQNTATIEKPKRNLFIQEEKPAETPQNVKPDETTAEQPKRRKFFMD